MSSNTSFIVLRTILIVIAFAAFMVAMAKHKGLW